MKNITEDMETKNCPFCDSNKYYKKDYKGLSTNVFWRKCLKCKKEYNRKVVTL